MWGPIIGAGISAIGSIAGGMMSSAGQSAANAQNAEFARQQAQAQMDFQERMSNTQYQRGMADMKKAGLNPILAYQQGGASAPLGAQGTANFQNAMEGLGQGVTSASKGYQNYMDLQQVKATTENTYTQADLNKANTGLSAANVLKANQDTATSAAQMRKADADTALTVEQMDNPKAYRQLMGAQSHSARAAGDLSDEQRKQLREYGPHWTGQAAGSAGRLWDQIVNAWRSGSITSPTDPRNYGLKGRPTPNGNGSGLTIDIKR